MAIAATLEGRGQINKAKCETLVQTDKEIADALEISRGTVQNFLRGKPISLKYFQRLCEHLRLDWEVVSGRKEAVAAPPEGREQIKAKQSTIELTDEEAELERWVQQVREQGRSTIEKRCGWIKVLDMHQPIELNTIYTDVNILEKLRGRTRRQLHEWSQGCSWENFDRFLVGSVQAQRVDGQEAVRSWKKLMIFGRPGTGKTTFLKRLATLCNQGTFLSEQVPIFVTLKEFAETGYQPGLLNFIAQYFAPELSMDAIDHLLQRGRGLVLLDGLDEVLEKDHDRILHEIRAFAQRYTASHIVITCRIAAQEYVFEQFTDVEISDFSDEQILDFADKWFKVRMPDQLNEQGNSTVAMLFWKALKAREPIKQLAIIPLLLTLLCLEFEQSAEFPQTRTELYERAVKVCLSRWDKQRQIKRDEVYQGLSSERKVRLLGHLAHHTFEQGIYLFSEHKAIELIGQYLQTLPEASTNLETLLVDSHAILKSIEAQHGLLTERATGIYSFSHLTFHEYFTAQHILDAVADPALWHSTLQGFVGHVSEPRWREVFLLVAERTERADDLLSFMKRQIDQMLVGDETLQHFLAWAEQKSHSIEASYKLAAIRAFYHALAFDLNYPIGIDIGYQVNFLATALDRDLSCHTGSGLNVVQVSVSPGSIPRAFTRVRDLPFVHNFLTDYTGDHTIDLDLDLGLDRTLAYALHHTRGLHCNSRTIGIVSDALACALVLATILDIERTPANWKGRLEELQEQLPTQEKGDQLLHWQETQASSWIEQLRKVMIEHRSIGHNWQFNDKQKEQLPHYYTANMLLVNCLNSSYVTEETRQQIEAELLSPVKRVV